MTNLRLLALLQLFKAVRICLLFRAIRIIRMNGKTVKFLIISRKRDRLNELHLYASKIERRKRERERKKERKKERIRLFWNNDRVTCYQATIRIEEDSRERERERDNWSASSVFYIFYFYFFFLRFDEYRACRYIIKIWAKFEEKNLLSFRLGRYDRIGFWFASLLLNLITYSIRSKPNFKREREIIGLLLPYFILFIFFFTIRRISHTSIYNANSGQIRTKNLPAPF